MHYHVSYSRKFKKQLRRLKKSGNFDVARVEIIISTLLDGKTLNSSFRDHQLTGDMKQYRECHVSGDLVIVYEKSESAKEIYFFQIGSHSGVFHI